MPLPMFVAEATAPVPAVSVLREGTPPPLSYLLEGVMSDMNPLGILISYPRMVSVWT